MKLVNSNDPSVFMHIDWKYARRFSYVNDYFDGVEQGHEEEMYLPAGIESFETLALLVDGVVKPSVDEKVPLRDYEKECIPWSKVGKADFLETDAEVPAWTLRFVHSLDSLKTLASLILYSDLLGFREFRNFGCFYLAWININMTPEERENAFFLEKDPEFFEKLFHEVYIPFEEKFIEPDL